MAKIQTERLAIVLHTPARHRCTAGYSRVRKGPPGSRCTDICTAHAAKQLQKGGQTCARSGYTFRCKLLKQTHQGVLWLGPRTRAFLSYLSIGRRSQHNPPPFRARQALPPAGGKPNPACASAQVGTPNPATPTSRTSTTSGCQSGYLLAPTAAPPTHPLRHGYGSRSGGSLHGQRAGTLHRRPQGA